VVWDKTSFCVIKHCKTNAISAGTYSYEDFQPGAGWLPKTVTNTMCHYSSAPPHHIERASGIRWGSIFISSLFKFFFVMWKHRNGVLHQNTPEEKEAIQRTRLLIIRFLNKIFLLLPEAQIEI
jgi:hypothetical protein